MGDWIKGELTRSYERATKAGEARLAEGGGFQIPLNPTVQATLLSGLLTPSQVKPMDADFDRATDRWEETQALLRKLFGG